MTNIHVLYLQITKEDIMLKHTISFVDGKTVIHVEHKNKSSNTGIVGIHRRKDGVYQTCKGKDILGWCKTLPEAIALRAEADRRKTDGTYDAWFAEIQSTRKNYIK